MKDDDVEKKLKLCIKRVHCVPENDPEWPTTTPSLVKLMWEEDKLGDI